MNRKEREHLLEQVTSAWRPRDRDGGTRPHPAWHDLPPEDRSEAFARTVEQRRLESALDPSGMSSTARAVLDRILTAEQE